MRKILIVEDEQHIQRLIKAVMEKGGYEVLTADTGEEALDLLRQIPDNPPDLVLLDILLPGIDGLRVLKKIKESTNGKAITVLMLSAMAQENIVLQGIKLGAVGYIRKPFHPKDLHSRVASYLK